MGAKEQREQGANGKTLRLGRKRWINVTVKDGEQGDVQIEVLTREPTAPEWMRFHEAMFAIQVDPAVAEIQSNGDADPNSEAMRQAIRTSGLQITKLMIEVGEVCIIDVKNVDVDPSESLTRVEILKRDVPEVLLSVGQYIYASQRSVEGELGKSAERSAPLSAESSVSSSKTTAAN